MMKVWEVESEVKWECKKEVLEWEWELVNVSGVYNCERGAPHLQPPP